MSNVLIGIIGVILFIGLALAGALFLGPRFQESTNNSKASAAVQAVAQISSAANMANVQGGTSVPAGATALDTTGVNSLQANGFLKSVPSNPTTAGLAPIFVSTAGAVTGDAGYVVMQLGDNDTKICNAIARQSGQTTSDTTPAVTAANALPASPSGCFTYSGTTAAPFTATKSYAFARI